MLGEDNSGRDSPDAKRIGITGYNVEAFYHSGGTATLEFVATKKGEFEFGDESRSQRKGLLVVS
jgi:hypothetical protein